MEVFKEYDIRGLITESFAKDLGNKLSNKYGDIAIITDPKESSKKLSKAFAKGVINAGNKAIICGTGPTDMSSVISNHLGIVSVMFTASHLSDKQDGIKFHDKKGKPFTKEMINELRNLPIINKEKGIIIKKSFKKLYFNKLLKRYNELFNHNLKGLKILVKTNNGCAVSHLLLKKLGATVDLTNKGINYDLIIEHDFDADRVSIIINDKKVNASLIACLLTKKFKGKIVASIDSLSILKKYSKVIESRVGDPFIIDSIIKNKAVMGVEPSGHYTDPEFTLTSSGTLFALIIAGIAYEKSIKEQLSELPSIKLVRKELNVNNKNEFMKKVINHFKPLNLIDGIKFNYNKATALIRPSNTEQVIRFQLENPKNDNDLQNLINICSEL